jgi:lipoprotein-anchoring transpeptidase ErfK/SrfK
MKAMKIVKPLFFILAAILSACAYLPNQPSIVLEIDDPGVPFKSGVTIRKATQPPPIETTIIPESTATPTRVSPTETPLPANTTTPLPTEPETLLSFSDDAFIVNDAYQPPAAGYDSTTPNDSPPAYNGSKYVLVDISEQHMYVYEGSTLVYSFVSSTGMNNATRVGTFSVLNKIPNAYGATWNIWMPHWLGIYWSGSLQNGIHALPILPGGGILWAGYLGTPISYGCVVLGTYEAQTLYNWVDIGTPVEIRW